MRTSVNQPRGSFEKGKAHPIDVHVGNRVRMRRTLLGFTQEKLGEALRLTFQQVQKYERGTNRISSSRLYQIGLILNVPVSFFFEEMPDSLDTRPGATAAGSAKALNDNERGLIAKRETLELVRAYYRIGDPKARKRVFELVKTLGKRSS